MSYIKNCSKCGERISLREMAHGQWVAFDANTDRPHKHGKGSRKRKTSHHLEHRTLIQIYQRSTNRLRMLQQL